MWLQKDIRIRARERGFHLITDELLRQLMEIREIDCGLAHFFIRHTSASLTINENADPTVRTDMENYFHRLVPENESYYRHTLEGSDDLPAHIKQSLLGCSLTIPVRNGALALGTWQGIYLGEHRNRAGDRTILVTVLGN